jgi:hypothetical protein
MSTRGWLTLILSAVLVADVGCYTRVRAPLPASSVTPDPLTTHIVGITTKAGQEVMFDLPANIADGRVTGWVGRKECHYPLADVQRFWVESRKLNKVRTAAAIGGAAAAVAITVGVIVVARDLGGHSGGSWGGGNVKCCLYVYSWDGAQFTFDTETATGAITRGLERDDYSLLHHLREQDGAYRLLISNDRDETQYTDLTELWVVDHERGARPRAAADGRIYTIADPMPPLEARDGRGNDLSLWLSARDRLIWEPEPADRREDIVITFPKPAGAREAKLLTSATLTPWAGEVGARLLGLLGRGLPSWYERIDHDASARGELMDWMVREEMFALKIWVEEPTGWEVRGMMPVAGPFVSDERVVPLDVSRVIGDRLRIRLQPPSGLWAFNSFAVDYGAERLLQVTKVAVREARDWAGQDVTGVLRATDGDYLEMPEMGQSALITFPSPPVAAGMERTVFLHSRGYYHVHLPEDGEPDHVTFQRVLATPGAGMQFSNALYTLVKQSQ